MHPFNELEIYLRYPANINSLLVLLRNLALLRVTRVESILFLCFQRHCCVLYFVFSALHFVFCILYFFFKYSVAIASCWPSHRRGRRNHVVSHSLFTPTPPLIISICIDICISLKRYFYFILLFLSLVNCISYVVSHCTFHHLNLHLSLSTGCFF